MTLELSAEQLHAVRRGETVRVSTPELGELLLVRADVTNSAGEGEQAAFAKLARQAADRWGRDNPFES